MRAFLTGLLIIAPAAAAVATEKSATVEAAPETRVQRTTELDGWTFVIVESGAHRLGTLAFRSDDAQAGVRGVLWFDGAETDWRPYVFTGDDLGRAIAAIEQEFLGAPLLRHRIDAHAALRRADSTIADARVTGDEFIPATNGYVAQFVFTKEEAEKFPGVLIGDDPAEPLFPRRVPCRSGNTNPTPSGSGSDSRPPIDVLPFMSGGGMQPAEGVAEDASGDGLDGGSDALASSNPACNPWTDWLPGSPNWTYTGVVALPDGQVECRYAQYQTRQRTCSVTIGCRSRIYLARETRVLDTLECVEPAAPCPPLPSCQN